MTSTSDSATYLDHQPTYHNRTDAAYVLPNDAPEHVRLEIQARCLSNIMNGQIIHAPIPTDITNAHMLDVGCGTGIVTDHLGTHFPQAQIYGLDLSPVPHLRQRPNNVHFLQGNITQDAPTQWLSSHPSDPPPPFFNQESPRFDLIYSRLLVCGLSHWPTYIQKSFALLKPGAHMESHDITWRWYDQTHTPISDTWQWLSACRSAAAARGMDLDCGEKMRGWMVDAGFEDVRVREYRWPMGGAWESSEAWREWGDYNAAYMPVMIWHMIARLLEGKGYAEREVRGMQEEVVRNLRAEEGKYWVMHVTVGRKPE